MQIRISAIFPHRHEKCDFSFTFDSLSHCLDELTRLFAATLRNAISPPMSARKRCVGIFITSNGADILFAISPPHRLQRRRAGLTIGRMLSRTAFYLILHQRPRCRSVIRDRMAKYHGIANRRSRRPSSLVVGQADRAKSPTKIGSI